MTDYKALSDLLVRRGKARGKPVAISLFRDRIPAGYEPITSCPCSIVHLAMDEGKKVYFDAEHHDCLVGVYHAGMSQGTRAVVAGEYLSKTSSFFTDEGAARLKSSGAVLPLGMVKAIGAAPLESVGDDVAVDWIVVVCNPYNAVFVAGGRLAQEGVRPYCTVGSSLCEDLFAEPWHRRNVIVAVGDFGGRMHNKLKQDQLFVVIPVEFARYIPVTLVDAKLDVQLSREMTKPPHSPFWLKQREKKSEALAPDPLPTAADAPAAAFTMTWTDEAKKLIARVPEEIREMVITNAETYAGEHDFPEVSRKSLEEQMKSLGMDLDEMLAMV